MRRVALAVGLLASGLPAAAAPAGAARLHVRDGLVWTRPDGTRAAYPPEVRVWCGRWASDVRVRAIHVWVGHRPAAHWELHAVVADVKRKRVVQLPNTFVFDHPKAALLYGTDRATRSTPTPTPRRGPSASAASTAAGTCGSRSA